MDDDLQTAAVTLAHEVKGAFGIAEQHLRDVLGEMTADTLLNLADAVLTYSRAKDAAAQEKREAL
jgi:hypothetical protein